MTIIDTTLFLNGELRLAAHGKHRGGTVLVREATGEQVDLRVEFTSEAEQYLTMLSDLEYDPAEAFEEVRRVYGATERSTHRYYGPDHLAR